MLHYPFRRRLLKVCWVVLCRVVLPRLLRLTSWYINTGISVCHWLDSANFVSVLLHADSEQSATPTCHRRVVACGWLVVPPIRLDSFFDKLKAS